MAETPNDRRQGAEATRRPPLPPPSAARPVRSVPPEAALPGPLRDLLDADGTGVVVAGRGPDGGLVVEHVNRAMATLLDVDGTEDLMPGAPVAGALRSVLDQLPHGLLIDPDGGSWVGGFDHVAPTGETRVYRATAHVAPLVEGGRVSLLAHDVTHHRDELAVLRHRAEHDPLTGLPNRHQMLERLAATIRTHRHVADHVAVTVVDIDHLKYVNDAVGHDVGDELIVAMARRLAISVRPNDVVGRLGSDEFVVVSDEVPDAVAALDLAERVRRGLSGRLRINGADLDVSVSIGVALSEPDVDDLDDEPAAAMLVGNADTAMHQAKSSGRGRCLLFTSHMRSAARERTRIASALKHAVEQGDLTVHYQPVFSAITQQAVAAEALVRWNHPVRGPMDPATFVSVAEESGTIHPIGDHVLHQALFDLRLWIEQQIVAPDFAVHVNVSRLQLASPAFVNTVLAHLREFRLQPAQLVLEARETALLGRDVDVARSVRALRRLGIQVAVDNFGTGANALSVLTDLGADVLKLDGALALPSGTSDADTRLVRALVLLAHALDMRVIAERVSGIEQLRRLRAAGCDEVQGHLLGEPQPAEVFTPTSAY